MTTSIRAFLATCLAPVLLAVALSACAGGGGTRLVSDADRTIPEPMPGALADAIDLVANDGRHDASRDYIGGTWYRAHNGGYGQNGTIAMTHGRGAYVSAAVSHDEDGNLRHNVAVIDIVPVQEAEPRVRFGRYIDTQEDPRDPAGVTGSAIPKSGHGIGSDWQATELTADYDGGGRLRVLIATDAQPSGNAMDPFRSSNDVDPNIELAGAPSLPADRDLALAWIGDGESIEGSLAGVAGTFSCANADGCAFVDDRRQGDFYSNSSGVSFTTGDGVTHRVEPQASAAMRTENYLALGYWLYVPEDADDRSSYDFGVFAGGGDPFAVGFLAWLTGTATYSGDAAGMYYVDGLSANPSVGSFTADVELNADFGDRNATGFVAGEVNNFVFEGDVASLLPATVTLASRTDEELPQGFGVPQGSTNIFDTPWQDRPAWPGGQIGGVTEADVAGEYWHGQWHGAIYGNGISTRDYPPSYVEHPKSIGGVFGTAQGSDNERSERGLTGSFGAHRQ